MDRRITVRGRRYLLRFLSGGALGRRNDGECDPPTKKGKEIRIRSTLRGEKRLEILIHELLHAGHWDLAEEAVAEMARDMARSLTQLGYSDGSEQNQDKK